MFFEQFEVQVEESESDSSPDPLVFGEFDSRNKSPPPSEGWMGGGWVGGGVAGWVR